MKAEMTRFISAEAGILPDVDIIPIRTVVLSFGCEEGPVKDLAISILDARQLVLDTLSSLSNLGDPFEKQLFSGK